MRKAALLAIAGASLIAVSPSWSTDWRSPGAQRCAVIGCSGGGNSERGPSRAEVARREREARANDFNNQGIAAWNIGDWETAAGLFQKALLISPDNPHFAGNLAKAQANLRNAREAPATYRIQSIGASLSEDLSPSQASGNLAFLGGGNPTVVDARYVPSGRGLVGGTRWITGYNVQNADPTLVTRAHEMMEAQMRLAGLPYSDGVDFNRYNFVLGIAASVGLKTDLESRVVFDEYREGQYSAENQAVYNSLKGRQFNELACHSNGAMVCLAALTNNDVIADNVTLYGPQITVESLKMWDAMVRSGKVKSVQIMVNRGDPVPPFSLAIGGGAAEAGLLSGIALLRPPTFVDVIHQTAPQITVRSFDCSAYPSLSCHGMEVYKANLLKAGCQAASSGRMVPGTSLTGRPRSGVLEPPPPC